jgi:hypothetical protein
VTRGARARIQETAVDESEPAGQIDQGDQRRDDDERPVRRHRA